MMTTTYQDALRGRPCQVGSEGAGTSCHEPASHALVCGGCFAIAAVCVRHAIGIDIAESGATCNHCGCTIFAVRHITDSIGTGSL